VPETDQTHNYLLYLINNPPGSHKTSYQTKNQAGSKNSGLSETIITFVLLYHLQGKTGDTFYMAPNIWLWE